jgi:hypothetical protein
LDFNWLTAQGKMHHWLNSPNLIIILLLTHHHFSIPSIFKWYSTFLLVLHVKQFLTSLLPSCNESCFVYHPYVTLPAIPQNYKDNELLWVRNIIKYTHIPANQRTTYICMYVCMYIHTYVQLHSFWTSLPTKVANDELLSYTSSVVSW